MEKHLIKCPCGNKFFARKPILSKSEVAKTRSKLNDILKTDEKTLSELLKEKLEIENEIKDINKNIRRTKLDIRDAETHLQCSSCHERIPALKHEVSE